MITLRFFGHLADDAGTRERVRPLAPTPEAVRSSDSTLIFLRPGHVRVAVNGRWAAWDAPLSEGDDVAFLPPTNAL